MSTPLRRFAPRREILTSRFVQAVLYLPFYIPALLSARKRQVLQQMGSVRLSVAWTPSHRGTDHLLFLYKSLSPFDARTFKKG